MAFTTRHTGIDLWQPAKFVEYGFCLCCKNEIAPGETGLEGKKLKPRGKGMKWNGPKRSMLCFNCLSEWKAADYKPGLCQLSRFKL